MPRISLDLQRYRVAQIVLREVVLNASDPNAYKEMNLLNRMVTGHDIDGDAAIKKSDEEQAIEQRLAEKYQITPDRANRLAKALGAVMNSNAGRDPDTTDPEPTH